MSDFTSDPLKEYEEARDNFWEGLFFQGKEHKQRFVQALQDSRKIDEDGAIDRNYAAAFYLLTADEWIWQSVQKYVPPQSKGGYIDFAKILKMDFSGGYYRMIVLANHLYKQRDEINVSALTNLDTKNFKVAISAIEMLFYGLRTKSLQVKQEKKK